MSKKLIKLKKIISNRLIRLKYIILYKRGKVDLNKCKAGDILIGSYGKKFKYIGRLNIPNGFHIPNRIDSVYNHQIQFLNSDLMVSRTQSGHVWANHNEMSHAEDIIRIL